MIEVIVPPNDKWILSFRHEFYPPGTQLAGRPGHEVKAATWGSLRDATSGALVASASSVCSVHDNFSRSEGRIRCLDRMLDPTSPHLTREQRSAVWRAYWDERYAAQNLALAQQIETAVSEIKGLFVTETKLPDQSLSHALANILLEFAEKARL